MVSHPDEDTRLQALLAVLWPSLQKRHARPFTEQPFDRNSRVEPSASQVYSCALRYAFEMTESPLPELYPRPQARELAEQAFSSRSPATAKGPRRSAPSLGPPLLDPAVPSAKPCTKSVGWRPFCVPERALRTVLSDEQETWRRSSKPRSSSPTKS